MASSISERALLVVVVAAMLAGAVSVQAAAGGSADAVRDAARAKLVEGVDALKRGEHQVALESFKQAYALVPSPKIHYDFGLAYLGLGRHAEALSAFERFLAEASDAPADKRDKAAHYVSELRARVGTGADVAKAAPAGPASPPAAVAPPAVPPPALPPAASSGQAPAAVAGASLGDGGSVETGAGAGRTVALSLGAAGVVLVGAGVTFGVLAKHESDSLSSDSTAGAGASSGMKPPFDRDKELRGARYETLQVIGLVAGVTGLAAGIVVYATTRGRVTVEPSAARALAGANLRVVF
jgi:hypothetical protein